MKKKFNTQNINIVFGIILPGDGNLWVDAGDVIRDKNLILEKFLTIDRNNFENFSLHIADLLPSDRVSAMQAFEAQAPALFQRLVDAVTDAYYTAPEVVAHVEAVANAGPREPLPQFDDALVATVMRTQAGKFRSC